MSRVHCQDLAHAKCPRKNEDALKKVAFWIGWRQDILIFLRVCLNCATAFSRKEHKVGKISSRVRASRPGMVLCLDTVGPLIKTPDHFRFVLSAQDAFSKKIFLFPLKSKQATEIAEKVLEIFLTSSPYDIIHSDNARELCGLVSEGVARALGARKTQSLFYSPRQNSVERFHRQLHSLLTRSLERHQDWSRMLLAIQFAYNHTKNSATQFTPEFLHTGRNTGAFTSSLLAIPEEIEQSYGQFAARICEDLQKGFQAVHENLKRAAVMNQERYNRGKTPPVFRIGQHILLYSPRVRKGQFHKWQRYWSTEAVVLDRKNETLYLVQPIPGSRKYWVYTDKMRPLPVEERE